MLGTKEIKRRIRGVTNIQQITKAMEMVAASRLKRAQARAVDSRPYFFAIQSLMEDLLSWSAESRIHPELDSGPESKKIGLILITSDRGLCGGFISNVIRQAQVFIRDHSESASLADPARGQGGENRAGGSAEGSGSAGGITLIPIGKRGYDYFRRRGFSIFAFFSQPPNVVTQTEVEEISSSLLKGYGRDFHELHLLYTQFESAIRSRPVILQLLPLGNPEGGIRNSSVSQADPARGLGEENLAGGRVGGSGSTGKRTPHSRKVEPLLEPEAEKMVKELLPKYISAELYGAMSESLASEQGARMVAMRSATDNAEDMIKNLTLRYNKSRQASITKELLEVITGAEALRSIG